MTEQKHYEEALQGIREFEVGGVSFKMVSVEGGTFQRLTYDHIWAAPKHSVTLNSFAIGQTEVTQALWTVVMGSNPSHFKGNSLPVEQVSWDDCQTFLTKLNQLTGQKFRLPTEAEWEYAARGGNKGKGHRYSGSKIIDEVAWYLGNSYNRTHPVATKQPNELGLYDMSGNVWEWCQDWYGSFICIPQSNPIGAPSGSHRVCRGGDWFHTARFCCLSLRNNRAPSDAHSRLGFRLAL